MKNIFVILTLLLFSLTSLNAQFEREFQFQWGSETQSPGKIQNMVVDQSTKHQYVLRASGSKWTVFHLNAESTLEKTKEYEVEKFNSYDRIQDIFFMSGKLYLLTSKYNESSYAIYVEAQEISKEDLAPIGNPKALLTKDGEFTKDGPKYEDSRFNIKFSSDGSHVMLLHTPGMVDNWSFKGRSKEIKRKNDFVVFNENLEEIYSQNELRFGEYEFVKEVLLDDDGWLYTLSFKSQGAEKAGLIVAFDETGDMAWSDTIKFGQFLKADYHIVSGDEDLTVFTFYSSSKTKELYNGLYVAVFNNEDGSRKYTTNNKFEKSLMDQFKSRSARILPGADIDELARDITLGGYQIKLAAGSFKGKVLIAEKTNNYYKEGDQEPSGKVYGDILVLKMKNDWSYEFGVRIPKSQYSTNVMNYERMTMAYLNNETSIHVFFNDSPKNYTKVKPNIREPYNADQNGGALIHYEIDMRNGTVVNEFPILSNKDKDVVTYPGLFRKESSSKMVVFGETSKFQVGELILY